MKQRNTTRLCACLLCAAMVLSLCTVFSLGASAAALTAPVDADSLEGAAETDWYDTNPDATEFTLESAEDLMGFAGLVNGGNSFAGKTVTLDCNVILNDGELTETPPAAEPGAPVGKWEGSTTNAWTPIGTATYPFSGTFDGNGKTVWGVYHSGTGKYTGFFGYITSATIKNLTATGKVYSKYGSGNPGIMGGIVAYAENSAISGCTNGIFVQMQHTQAQYDYVGGIVGHAKGATSVTSCTNVAGVFAQNTKKGTGAKIATGGIVGYAEGTSMSVKVTVSGCENSASICVSEVYPSRHTRLQPCR